MRYIAVSSGRCFTKEGRYKYQALVAVIDDISGMTDDLCRQSGQVYGMGEVLTYGAK